MNYFNKYAKLFPELLKEKIVIVFIEGLGEYKGTAYHKDLHPKGRMGAKVQVYFNGVLKYESNNASTLPDEICGRGYSGNGNDGLATPTAVGGVVWDVYAKHHLGRLDSRYNALEIGLGGQNIEVIRDGKLDRSNAINIHYRPMSDYTTKQYVTSAGCLTILESVILNLLEIIGATRDGSLVIPGTHIGKVIIDRTYLSPDLQLLYKSLYKGMYDDFIGANLKEVPEVSKPTETDDQCSKWATEAWEWAVEKGLVDGKRPRDCVTREEMAVVMYRLYQLHD